MLPAIRSSRFDLPLTYAASDVDLAIGDIVRIPLGRNVVFGFVTGAPMQAEDHGGLREVLERCELLRAFDDEGLALARFVAERYCSTLLEGLNCVMLASALPRDVPRIEVHPFDLATLRDEDARALYAGIATQFEGGVAPQTLLRHPLVRRIGDRPTITRLLEKLRKAGAIARTSAQELPSIRPYTIEVLRPGVVAPRGRKACELVAFVAAHPEVSRADTVLAGYASATISRLLRAGMLEAVSMQPQRTAEHRRIALPSMAFTPEQERAFAHVAAALETQRFAEVLLHGVTGSGKTLIYLHLIARALELGGRALVLVPEISLTPQAVERFEAVFGGRVAVLHSALSERERFDTWQACANGEVEVVVGARSAVFAPLANIRVIVVDEAHDPSYKQENAPRYHAIAVARERMRRANGLLILGSATPAMEHEAAARSGRIERLMLRERATAQPLPQIRIVDMRQELAQGNRRIFSAALTQALDERLRLGEKSVLFINRRGSAVFVLCRTCGNVPECPRCSVSLTAHRGERLLRCHYCDFRQPLSATCPACGVQGLREFGVGTERVVEEVARLYPRANVVRMDADTTTRVGDHARLLTRFATDGDVLVGTQMVAKGLDFPTVTLVGVVAADLGLHAPDFRASERSFALITQVCGRSGRARLGEAVVQTYQPAHPVMQFVATHDDFGFAQRELEERRAVGYPPTRRLIYLGVIGRDRDRCWEVASMYARMLGESGLAEVLGPAPYPLARLNEEWRMRVALKTDRSPALRAYLRAEILPLAHADRSTRLAINVDP